MCINIYINSEIHVRSYPYVISERRVIMVSSGKTLKGLTTIKLTVMVE